MSGARTDFRPEVLPRTIAKSCPFCGQQPTVEPWHGGKPTKRRVACGNSGCHLGPGVTGDTRAKAISLWNLRAPIMVQP